MKIALRLATLLPALIASSYTSAVDWAHQTSDFASNGAITIKSLSGGTYAGTQNPTGAVAKTNQNAVTQPPTIIVQATNGGTCYTFQPPTGMGFASESHYRTGIGTLTGTTFKGVLGYLSSDRTLALSGALGDSTYAGNRLLIAALSGGAFSANGADTTHFRFVGTSSTDAWTYTSFATSNPYYIVAASSLTVRNSSECFP